MSFWRILFIIFKILVFFGQKRCQHQILPTILFLPSLQSWSRVGSISRSSHIWGVISTCRANRWSSKDFQRLLSWLLSYKYIFIHLLVVAVGDPFIHHENLWSRGLHNTNMVDGIIENVSKSPPPDMQKRCTWFEALGSPLFPPCFLSGWTSDVHHPAWLRTTWLLTNLWTLWYFGLLKPSSIFWSWGR